jgi:tripartite-type tricarboxylate transporter receptor subunit TctC
MFSYLLRAIAIAALANSIGAFSARTDDYPSRPVKIIAPFGAGGPTDLYAREIAEELRKALHQTFYIENRPGAGTTIGTDMVAKADPDGYTLLMVSGTQTVNETLYANKPYHLLQDLVPIAPLIETDLVMVEHPSVPAKSLSELLALARAKPGTLNFGSSGPGSNYHMAAELLKNLTGIDIVHVPYKGSTGMRSDILSGQIQLLFDSVPTMAPLIDSGAVRPLGTSGITRSPILPDVPTMLSRHPVDRLHGAGAYAAADRRFAQPHHHHSPEAAGHKGSPGKARRHAVGDEPAGIPIISWQRKW